MVFLPSLFKTEIIQYKYLLLLVFLILSNASPTAVYELYFEFDDTADCNFILSRVRERVNLY